MKLTMQCAADTDGSLWQQHALHRPRTV